MQVDVIIPVYGPGEKFGKLLAMLERQTCRPNRVIVMNTERTLWEDGKYSRMKNLEVHHLTKEEFDHGGTRNRGAGCSSADIVVFMTDDAVPENDRLLEELVKGFESTGPAGERVAVVYARQLADSDCRLIERYTRSFNYPGQGAVKTKGDLKRLGIKTYFASNVCCAYDREIYEKLGGFTTSTIFNEDMIYAAGAIAAGYAVVYRAEARVVHSHNYSGIQQFHRNFDLGVSQADHPEVFSGIPSESEGIRLVRKTASYLLSHGTWYLIPELVWKSGWKFLGYRLGKRYGSLPKKLVLWCTMNPSYWRKNE